MVMEEKELRKVLDSHKRWLKGEMGGERASLVGADLSDTKLAGLDLEGPTCGGPIWRELTYLALTYPIPICRRLT